MERLIIWTFVKVLLLTTACSFPQQKEHPSFLLIAVEKIPYTSEICAEYNQKSSGAGISEVCESFIRYTHMISPSPQSQAALASLFTGLYPIEHNVWHNGNHFLHEEYESVPEGFYKKGYRTSFFSGGGSIWRKSGFAQGFMLFDDYVSIHLNNYYRPAKNSFQRFLDWIEGKKSKPFFSVIYVPDLVFPTVTTINEEGISREASYTGQWSNFSDSLSYLFQELKKRGLWHKTNIILTGLNGVSGPNRFKEYDAYNLLSENTQVAFFYKPADKKRDTQLVWKDDNYHSLVDVGYSFQKFLGKEVHSSIPLKRHDLFDLNREPDSPWILIESAWPLWRNKSNIRYSLRKGNMAYIFDKKTKVYNSLIDRLETNPQFMEEFPLEVSQIKEQINFDPWNGIETSEVSKIRLGEKLWNPLDEDYDLQAFLDLFYQSGDIQILEWMATICIDKKKWQVLENIGVLADRPLWRLIAKANLEKDYLQELQDLSNKACIRQFFSSDLPDKRKRDISGSECEDRAMNHLYEWVRKGERAAADREKLIQIMLGKTILSNIYKLHYLASLSWDISLLYPRGPSDLDLVLALDKYKIYKRFISNRIEMSQDEKIVY